MKYSKLISKRVKLRKDSNDLEKLATTDSDSPNDVPLNHLTRKKQITLN